MLIVPGIFRDNVFDIYKLIVVCKRRMFEKIEQDSISFVMF